MSRLTPFLVIGFIGLAEATCIAPVMPGPSMCGECDDLRGSQCVSSGRWFSCHKSIADCCDSWDIKNQVSSASCVAASEAVMNAGAGPDPNENLPQVDNDYCKKVVSLSEAQTNAYCMDECDALMGKGTKPENNSSWASKCTYSHWYPYNGRTVVDGDCFEKWIYGYSQEVNLASIDQTLIVDTPAQCQLHCQLNEDCVNWAWVSELYASTGSEKVGRCLLKNKTMVEMALTIKTSVYPSPNMNAQYCNYGLPHECSTKHYRCLPCDGGDLRCVWESDMHISGWKYCTPTDTCAPFNPLPTLAPATSEATTTVTTTTTTTRAVTAAPTTPKATPAPTQPPTTPAPTEAPTTTPPPTPAPTPAPTEAPTPKPTPAPTEAPQPEPTPAPTEEPTPAPKPAPTEAPKPELTSAPTEAPTPAPTPAPTEAPKPEPTFASTEDAKPEGTPGANEDDDSEPASVSTPSPQGPGASDTGMAVGTEDALTRPPTTPAPVDPSMTGEATYPATQAPVNPSPEPTPAPEHPNKDTTTGIMLDHTSAEDKDEDMECHPKESTEEGALECVRPPKKPSCSDNCECRGRPHCSCCERGQLYIRVSDRPKRLHFELEN